MAYYVSPNTSWKHSQIPTTNNAMPLLLQVWPSLHSTQSYLYAHPFEERKFEKALHGNAISTLPATKTNHAPEFSKPSVDKYVKWCSKTKRISTGKYIHAGIVSANQEHCLYLRNLLVEMYGECGMLGVARHLFDSMQESNLFSWTIVIKIYIQRGDWKEAVRLFRQMELQGIQSDRVSFINILSAFSSLDALAEGKFIHGHIVKTGLECDVVLGTALLNMYGKCGALGEAYIVIQSLQETNIFSYNSIMGSCSEYGYFKEGLELFKLIDLKKMVPDACTYSTTIGACGQLQSLAEGKRLHARAIQDCIQNDLVVGTSLVNMYGKCGCLEGARMVVSLIYQHDVYLWTSIISIYSEQGEWKSAFYLWQQMQYSGILPNRVTFLSILDACACLGSFEVGKMVHTCTISSGMKSDISVQTALIDMYYKCGDLKGANKVFDNRCKQDMYCWTAIMTAHAQYGHGKNALDLLKEMQRAGIRLTEVTLVSVLSACSYSGLLNEGCHYFVSMSYHFFTPSVEHFRCMLDMIGRACSLDEVEDFICKMPIPFEPLDWVSYLFPGRKYSAKE